MIAAGLDLSLTSTGTARIDGTLSRADRWQPRKLTGHDRLDWLLQHVENAVYQADIVVIEGPSYGSPLGQHQLGGLWWLITHLLLYRNGIPYAVVPPASLKKYATGKGNAGKDQVLLAASNRYPESGIDGNDTADALVLAAMAADFYGFPLREVPKLNRSALASVTWPGLGVRSASPGG